LPEPDNPVNHNTTGNLTILFVRFLIFISQTQLPMAQDYTWKKTASTTNTAILFGGLGVSIQKHSDEALRTSPTFADFGLFQIFSYGDMLKHW
jgi:hypothetical protein